MCIFFILLQWKAMVKREQLSRLSEAYLRFLISRDESILKSFLSLDFQTRLKVSQQLKLIKTLPMALNYGISPEAHLWADYVTEQSGEIVFLSPFQFDVSYRNLMNPLLGETMTVTVHSLVLEKGVWKIASVLSDPDHDLLLHYSSKNKVLDNNPVGPDRKTQPKK